MREIIKLVGGYHCHWNEFAFSVPRFNVSEYPHLDAFDERLVAFSQHLFEHPGVVHAMSTGDPGPFAISDLVSERELYRLQLYQRVLRQMGQEDQIGMMLFPPKGEVVALIVGRDRRGFSDRDRQVMALIRPHLAQAYSNLRTLARARSRPATEEPDETALALLEVGPGGEIRRGLPWAEPMLTHYFRSGNRHAPSRLPAALVRWLKHRWRTPFVARRGARQLTVRFFPGTSNAATGLVLLEDHAAPPALSLLQAGGLTAREAQVLTEVEKGLSNDDIAAALFISPHTVRKHLENIYAKLHVSNRTSAVAFLRRMTTQ